MSKTSIRIIAVLITLATVGVVIFQISWLKHSYIVSKEQLRQDISKVLDKTMHEHKRRNADSVRWLLKMIIRSDSDFRYDVFYHSSGTQIGIRARNHDTYTLFDATDADVSAIQKAPYAFLMNKMGDLQFNKLRPLYSVLVGSQSYFKNSADDKIAERLMYKFELIYSDTVAATRVLKQLMIKAGLPSDGQISFYDDINNIYQRPKPPIRQSKVSTGPRVVSVIASSTKISLADKLDELDEYTRQVNNNDDICFVAKPLLYSDAEDLLMNRVMAWTVTVKISLWMILSNMIGNIGASIILITVVSICMVYMLRTIIKQKELADIKNDFISNISHELKTPVATALAAVQGMKYFDVLKDPLKTASYLNTAEAEIKRLGVMVNKIINVSIFESKGFKLNPVTFNFKQMLTDIISAQTVRQEKKISIHFNYQAREELFADRVHVQNLIVNLIDNAINYSGEQVGINIECINVGPNLQIRISDNGVGIPAEFQKMIFDKFFRVPKAGNPKGYGLGLNYVKHIIEKHHGSIILERSDADGSTFMVSLPG